MSSLILDTHLLLWAANEPDRLPAAGRNLILDPTNTLLFSAVSIWEVAIKHGQGRDDFQIEPNRLRRGLANAGYVELAMTSDHAATVAQLPPIHRDPFDRMLIAQAIAEGVLLVTSDPLVGRYPGPILLLQ
ncbi:twitching motility protein PilT [Allostella vacuolata]|nr:twitching motility protein PilT [Stella vacuolata]